MMIKSYIMSNKSHINASSLFEVTAGDMSENL